MRLSAMSTSRPHTSMPIPVEAIAVDGGGGGAAPPEVEPIVQGDAHVEAADAIVLDLRPALRELARIRIGRASRSPC